MKCKLLAVVALVCALALAPTEQVLAYNTTIDLDSVNNNLTITTQTGHLLEAYNIAPGHSVTETLYIHNNSNQVLDIAWIRFTESNNHADAGEFNITIEHNGQFLTQKPLGYLVASGDEGEKLTPLAPNATTEYDVTLRLNHTAKNQYQLQEYFFDFVFAIGVYNGINPESGALENSNESWTNISIPLIPNTGSRSIVIGNIEIASGLLDAILFFLCLIAVVLIIIIFKRRRHVRKPNKRTSNKR